MSNRILFLVTIVVALLQGPFLPSVFFEGLLVVLILSSGNTGIVSNARKVILQLFLSGFIFDLVQSTKVGTTSIVFLAIGFFVYFLRNTVLFQRPSLAAMLGFAVVIIRGKILFSNFFLVEALMSLFLVFLLSKYILRPTGDRLDIE